MKLEQLTVIYAAIVFIGNGCGDGTPYQATRVGNPPLPQLVMNNVTAVGLVLGKAANSQGSLEMTDGSSQIAANDIKGPSILLGIQSSGTSAVLDDKHFAISKIKGVTGGFLMEGRQVEQDEYYVSLYFVRLDGKVFELLGSKSSEQNPVKLSISGYYSDFVGQADNRDLFFANGDVFRFSSGKVEALPVNLEEARIDSVSGNFLRLTGKNGMEQVYDVTTGKRYNVTSSNSLVALSNRLVFLPYSGSIFDMKDGTSQRSPIEQLLSAVRVKDGAIGATYYCDPSPTASYHLCHLAADGKRTLILSDPVTSDVKLQVSGDYIVAQELQSLFAVKRGQDKKIPILQGLNVFENRLANSFVYYRAETPNGNLVTQIYDLDNAQTYEIKNWSSQITQLEAIGR